MNKGDAIVIMQTANGWIVEPQGARHIAPGLSEMLVFNDMGYASFASDEAGPCLLKFIEEHFRQPESENTGESR